MLYRIIKVLGFLSIILCAAAPAMAAKVGGEFLVNTKAQNSSVAPLPGGGFVVVWSGDGPDYPIFGQRYDKSAVKIGPRLEVLPASPVLTGPVAAALDGGGFVVTWAAPDPSGLGVWVQRFNANGAKLGTKFRANTTTAEDQLWPSAAGLENGTFVVTWTSNNLGGPVGDSNVFVQRFNANGAKIGGEVRVDTTFAIPAAAHQFSSAAALASGGYVIVDNGYNGTYARLFAANGAPLGDDFRVNLAVESLTRPPVVAGLKNGGFVVVREVLILVSSETDIYGQRFDAAGLRVGGDFRVNVATVANQLDPAVAALSNGGFVVTYSEDALDLCKGRLYNANGGTVGGNFTANTAPIPIDIRSSVAPQPGGAFVVTYQSSATSGIFIVRGQRFDGK